MFKRLVTKVSVVKAILYRCYWLQSSYGQRLLCEFQINNCTITFKIDTGAKCNVILDQNQMKPKQSERLTFKFCAKIDTMRWRFRWLREMACQLVCVRWLFTVGCRGDEDPHTEIFKWYQGKFSGNGTLPGEYEINIDASITPVVHPPRRIPYLLRDKVKAELDRMERMVNTRLTTFDTPFVRFIFEGYRLGWCEPLKYSREPCEEIVDDLLVWGKNVEEHDLTFKKVLQREVEIEI